MSDKLLGSRIAGGNTAYKRSEADYYPTPPEVSRALLDILDLPPGSVIWEPACGAGHMVEAIRAAGFTAIGTDINSGVDFLTAPLPAGTAFIMTNPPLSLAADFIERALSLGVPFAFLLKAQFWHARSRYELFYKHPPAYVLPLTWRPDFLFKTRGGGAPLMDVMWCLWHPGDTKTKYMPLERPRLEEESKK